MVAPTPMQPQERLRERLRRRPHAREGHDAAGENGSEQANVSTRRARRVEVSMKSGGVLYVAAVGVAATTGGRVPEQGLPRRFKLARFSLHTRL